MTQSPEQSQSPNGLPSNESSSSDSYPVAVILDGQEAGNNSEAPSLANSGPQLDAIRGNDIPTIIRDGLQAPKEPRRRRRRASDVPTEASRMTVWDRGESLYAEAFPQGSRRPEVARPSKPATAPLLDRVDSLRLRSSQPNGAGFYPRGSVEALVTEEEVARVIAGGRLFLESAGRPPLAADEIQRYARRVCGAQPPPDGTDRGFKKIFAILLLLDRGWEIVLFVDAGIDDSQLPLEAVYVNGTNAAPRMRLAGDPNNFPLACLSGWSAMMHERFEQTQWSMLAPFFARGTRRRAKFYQLSDKVVLPWIKEERSGREGGYGWISKVEIHPSHHNFDRSDSEDELRDEAERPPRRVNNLFAVKHFKPNIHARVGRRRHSQNPGSGHTQTGNGASNGSNLGDADALTSETILRDIRREFEREIEILNRFSGDTHEHLISLQAAFRHGDEYCVIIPWAEGDLKNMWMGQSHGDPLDKANLEWLLKQCSGIASGLQKIHFYQTSETLPPSSGDTDDDSDESNNDASSRRVYGRHGDIKPENILLFRNPHDPGDRGRLVITDFGLTRFHTDGTKTYFKSKDVVATLTYRPPECDMEGCTISRSFDIWSLGCVLLEFVAWYLGGWELVHSFVQHRKVDNPLVFGYRIDQFFEIVRARGPPDGRFYSRVKHEVHDFVNNKLHTHPASTAPIHTLLDFVLDEMLVVESTDAHARADCRRVYSTLDALYASVAAMDPSSSDSHQQLVAAPRPPVRTCPPEAVVMPLNVRTRESATQRYRELREHTGRTRRLHGDRLRVGDDGRRGGSESESDRSEGRSGGGSESDGENGGGIRRNRLN